jgi:hypothetical protein
MGLVGRMGMPHGWGVQRTNKRVCEPCVAQQPFREFRETANATRGPGPFYIGCLRANALASLGGRAIPCFATVLDYLRHSFVEEIRPQELTDAVSSTGGGLRWAQATVQGTEMAGGYISEYSS